MSFQIVYQKLQSTAIARQLYFFCQVDKRQWSGTDTIEFHIMP